MDTNLVAYYKNRAEEYEKIYSKPERQEDLLTATTILQEQFANKEVLEIACGTGYWTERIAKTSGSVFATDINEAVIDIAKRKTYPTNRVQFGICDIYDCNIVKKYESLFAGFIWSHIYLQDLDKFLDTLNTLVIPGGTIVIMDNKFVAESNLPIAYTDELGNTFQNRKLENNSTHLILKNFPTEDFLKTKIKSHGTDVQLISLKYYWILIYKVPLIKEI